MPHIQLILGTTRENRFSERAGAWAMDRLQRRTDLTVEMVDLRDYRLEHFALPRSPAGTQRDYPSEMIAEWGNVVDRADGYVVVTGEYNHGYPAVLKDALDHVFVELNRKPMAFIGYGNVGGARAIEQLRQVVVEMELAPVRHAVHILPEQVMAARASDPFDIETLAPLDGRLDQLATTLVWWAVALAAARERCLVATS
jgi:NAD(P)H-dependent FMN reductase